MHRLNNQEYDNTIRDLLGVPAAAHAGFVDDEKGVDFDNDAESLIVTDVRYALPGPDPLPLAPPRPLGPGPLEGRRGQRHLPVPPRGAVT
jgi:hypothetical protein